MPGHLLREVELPEPEQDHRLEVGRVLKSPCGSLDGLDERVEALQDRVGRP